MTDACGDRADACTGAATEKKRVVAFINSTAGKQHHIFRTSERTGTDGIAG